MIRLRTAVLLLAALAPGCRGEGPRAAPPTPAGAGSVTLVGGDEPGEPLVVSGRVVDAGGEPVEGARLLVYHTDAGGYYTRPVSTPRRARLRGSVTTDEEGRYEFRTIRPGPYPSGDQPAHIHAHLDVPGLPEHWIESYYFADDPLLGVEARERAADRFSPVLELERDEDGVLRGTRDIRVDADRARENHLVDGWYQGE